MRHDQVAIGDDTYETTTLPAYRSVSAVDMIKAKKCTHQHPTKIWKSAIPFQIRIQLKGQI